MISKKTLLLLAPKLYAASIICSSISISLARTIRKTYGIQKLVWAIRSVIIPKGRFIKENISKNTIPKMISGIIIGNVDNADIAASILEFLFLIPSAAPVAIRIEKKQLPSASMTLLSSASFIPRSAANS